MNESKKLRMSLERFVLKYGNKMTNNERETILRTINIIK